MEFLLVLLVLWGIAFIEFGLPALLLVRLPGLAPDDRSKGEIRTRALIPLVNAWLLLSILDISGWWILVSFVPIANIIAGFYLAGAIPSRMAAYTERAHASNMWGLLGIGSALTFILFPVVLIYLAASAKSWRGPAYARLAGDVGGTA